ncbi:DUF2897 family protein [Salinivibrio costicola]|uniref:DUF2897 family protein n=1 Tax=Salinivibrio costicola subsp. alcaliphilus TaxID=272773 RepID=A0ABX3KUJ7_SALCS|nr:DUF2897 family protein [Salinivibrio costicola]OOF35093.1 hypothetical protein BZJ21_02275 [Salinivibrio costicola subsp. alcaliphilus]
MEWLTNPYVIITIVVAVVVSNIMALKYTANAKFGLKYKDKPDKHQRSAPDDDANDNTDLPTDKSDDKK